MADRTNHKTYEDRGVSYSALKPSACNFGVTARIPSRHILLSSDGVAAKLLNTLDSINNLVQSYLNFFSQIKILRCSVISLYFFNVWISDSGLLLCLKWLAFV